MSIDDRNLDQRLANLPRQAEPEEMTWQAIEARLKPRTKPRFARRFVGLSMAASLVIATFFITQLTESTYNIQAQIVSAEISAMQNQIAHSDMPKSDTTNSEVIQAWAENQQAIDELEKELKRNPDNSMLLDFLARAHLRHAELIHYASATTANLNIRSL